MMKSAPSANVHHIFCPFTTHWSPTSSARQRMAATSEPAPGSESAKAPRHSPRAIFGSISLRFSSLKPAPMPLPRAMRLATLIHARASSSVTSTYSKSPSPRPPYSCGMRIPK